MSLMNLPLIYLVTDDDLAIETGMKIKLFK